MKTYKKSVLRPSSLFDVKAWYEGESKELEKWLGFGFYNHLFVCKNKMVRLYYDAEEGDAFDKVLNKELDEELFDKLCDNIFEQIEKSKDAKTDKEIYELIVKCWPSFVIFDIISKYPEYASETMMRRLMRVRKATESFAYEIDDKIDTTNMPKNFIFFKGELIEKPFEELIQENKIIIKE